MSNIKNLYNNLNNFQLSIFWTIVFFVVLLLIICISLGMKNKELRSIIKKLNENKKFNIINNSNIDFSNIKLVKNNHKPNEMKAQKVEDLTKTGIYEKNILLQVGTKNQTSPVSIGKVNDIINLNETQKLEPININQEIINNSDVEDAYYDNIEKENVNFIEDIVIPENIAKEEIINENEELPIEFTSFENDQEKDAIISYKELIKNTELATTREERFNVEIDDDNEFLKELKSFRSSM